MSNSVVLIVNDGVQKMLSPGLNHLPLGNKEERLKSIPNYVAQISKEMPYPFLDFLDGVAIERAYVHYEQLEEKIEQTPLAPVELKLEGEVKERVIELLEMGVRHNIIYINLLITLIMLEEAKELPSS